jgi:beta-glucosidase-like glycosyl hydrolase
VADALREGRLGGLILFRDDLTSLADTRLLVEEARALAPGPILVTADEEGGLVSQLDGLPLGGGVGGFVPGAPSPRALSGSSSGGDVTDVFEALGMLLAAADIDVTFAPCFDVNTTSDNPVIGSRSFGADAEVVGGFGLAALVGLTRAGRIGCAKHFPGHGSTRRDSHHTLPSVVGRPPDLPAFRAAVDAGVPLVMTAHVSYPELDPSGAPATLSAPILDTLLRDELGFDGAVVSDALEMKGFAERGTGARAALMAGVDLLLVGREPDLALAASAELDEAGPHLARAREALGRRERLVSRVSGPVFEVEGAVSQARGVLDAAHDRALGMSLEGGERSPSGLRVFVPEGAPEAYVDAIGIAGALGVSVQRVAGNTLSGSPAGDVAVITFERGNVRESDIDSLVAEIESVRSPGSTAWALAPADPGVLSRVPETWRRIALTGTHRSTWEALARAWSGGSDRP